MDVEDEQPVDVPFYLSMRQKAAAMLHAYFCVVGAITGVSILRYGTTLAASEPNALDDPYWTLWNATFGGPGVQSPDAMICVGDGYVVAGTNQTSPFGQEAFLLHVDRDGALVWSRSYGQGYEDWSAMDLIQTKDGGYIMVGMATKPRQTGGEMLTILVLRVGPDGEALWNKTYSDAYSQSTGSIVETGEDEYLVLGTTRPEEGSFNYDICLMKIDSEGMILWNRTYGGDRYDWGHKIKKCMTGGYIIAGSTTSFHSEQQDPRFTNAYVIRIREDGAKIWEHAYGGLYNSVALDIVETEPEVYVLAGTYGQGVHPFSSDRYIFKIRDQGA